MKQTAVRLMSLADEAAVAERLSVQFDIPLQVKISTEALEACGLTLKEALRFGELKTAERRDSWLKGRTVLKKMLACWGESEETANISFPNRRLSLSHSGEYAVSVGTHSARLLGIGIDLEMKRSVRPEAARFFLTKEEQDWVLNQKEAAQSEARLRLWTIKEALFKSDCDNHGMGLADYAVKEPAKYSGQARLLESDVKEFHYSCLEFERAFLSVAILLRG